MSNIIELEEWRKTPSLPANIEVSSFGRIRKYVTLTEYVIVDPKQYKDNSLYFNYDKRTYSVHRLVAEAFIPNPDDLPIVKHMDGDVTNNNVSNLRWDVPSGNFYSKASWNSCIYCYQTDELYFNLLTASMMTGLDRELITCSITEECTMFGLTFRRISSKDAANYIGKRLYRLDLELVSILSEQYSNIAEFIADIREYCSEYSIVVK